MAEHIEEGYERRGLSRRESERRAWATVNAVHHGGEKRGGGGYGRAEDHGPMRRGAKKAAASRRSKKTSVKRAKAGRKK